MCYYILFGGSSIEHECQQSEGKITYWSDSTPYLYLQRKKKCNKIRAPKLEFTRSDFSMAKEML